MTSALVERWVTGWCLSRQMSWSRDGESWLVEVAAETRSQERIAATPSLAEAHRLVEATTAPDVWLTFIGELHASVGAAVGSLDRVSGSECMMTERVEPGSVPAGVVIEHDGPSPMRESISTGSWLRAAKWLCRRITRCSIASRPCPRSAAVASDARS